MSVFQGAINKENLDEIIIWDYLLTEEDLGNTPAPSAPEKAHTAPKLLLPLPLKYLNNSYPLTVVLRA
jgi:hypothetical protein